KTWDEWWKGISDQLDERAVSATAQWSALSIAQPSSVPLSCVSDDSWVGGSLATPTPDPRSRPTAVWTGSVMIIWGGGGDVSAGSGPGYRTGSRYDPATDTW